MIIGYDLEFILTWQFVEIVIEPGRKVIFRTRQSFHFGFYQLLS